MKHIKTLFWAFCALSLFACEKDDENNISEETKEINRFIHNTMEDIYLWNSSMPDLDYKTQNEPFDYFEDLLNKEDLYSFITDDAEAYFASNEGIEYTYGYIYIYMYADESETDVVCAVCYVYEGSAADQAGLKRGDIIYAVNGQTLNDDNYHITQNLPSVKLDIIRNTSANDYTQHTIQMSAKTSTLNPVAEYGIFDGNIGYLFYTGFLTAFNDDLNDVFNYFIENNVKDVILDLRYNTGGDSKALQFLTSMLAPKNHVQNEDPLIIEKYNNHYRDSYLPFDPTLSDRSMNLNHLVIITGTGTYSASEATILGLSAYMDVTCIGINTGGKNYGMHILTPDIFKDEYDSSINNWLIAPIVSKFYNAKGVTFGTEGITPDYTVNEFNYWNIGEIGHADEPLTKAACEYLTSGQITTTTLNTRTGSTPRILDTEPHLIKGLIIK